METSSLLGDVELLPTFAWLSRIDGTLIGANLCACEYLGIASERITQETIFTFIDPADRPVLRDALDEAIGHDSTPSFRVRIKAHSGEYRWHAINLRSRTAPGSANASTIIGVALDTSYQDEARTALEERNLRLALSMQAAKVRIMSLDVRDWQMTLESHVTAIAPSEPMPRIPYTTILKDINDDDIPALDAVLKSMANGSRDRGEFEYRIRREDGVHFMKANVVLQCDERGRPRSIVGSLWDVTEFKQLEVALRNADRRKDEFLAMLAHELRNPLAPLRTGVALLERDRQHVPLNVVGMMSRQVEHMTHLVDDLLEVSRITQGRIILRPEDVALDSALTRVHEAVEGMFKGRAQRLTIAGDASDLCVHVDKNRFAQILINILNNASKYSPDGSEITIRTSVEHVSHPAPHPGEDVVIEVTDHGSGITADLLPNVFDLFAQGARTLDRSEGGLGIGLSIVKRLVDKQGGSITISSAGAGAGTTVRLGFPHVLRRAQQSESAPEHRPSQHLTGPLRILIVDDNKDAADSLSMLCETEQHNTRAAYDPIDGIEIARNFEPEVALLDIGLPGMDGYELAGQLKSICPQPPLLIAITGYGKDEDRLRSKAAGFDHHFVKPVDIKKLLAVLNAVA